MVCLYPLFVDLDGRKVVVVGGGQVAQRKVEALLASEAAVVVISTDFTAKLAELADNARIQIEARRYQPGDLAGAYLVISACDEAAVNQQVHSEAEQLGILCNVVDQPSLCTFHVPSVVNRGLLQIAISTGGASPALAKRIRRELQEQYGSYYETLLIGMKDLRKHVKNKYPVDQQKRAAIFEEFVNSKAIDLLRAGKIDAFERLLEQYKEKGLGFRV